MIILGLVLGFILPPVTTWLWWPFSEKSHKFPGMKDLARFTAAWFVNSVLQTLITIFMIHVTAVITGNIISVITSLVVFYTRNKIRHSSELLGAKSRALRDSLVRRMREETI